MGDYIMNRESLKRHCEAMCHKFKDVPTSGTYGEHRLVLDLLEQTRWIPVSERLPKSDVDVLTQYSDGSMSVDFRTASSSGWFWADEDLPIAWMPLPEPYKAESEDKE